jgi:hypothetical protein
MNHVYFNFQGNAVLGVLAFLGFGFAEFLAVVTALVLFARRKRRAARRVLIGALAAAGLYVAVLLSFSLASREQLAKRAEEKYFCEVDCHLAYSVVDVRESKSLGTGSSRAMARGLYRIASLRVRFDPETTSSHRPKDMSLTPNPRSVRVVDASGTIYRPDPTGQRALESVEGAAVPLTRALVPGESYVTRLVFDLPEKARDPRLLITESDWITRALIGHENSPFHGKTSFRLGLSRAAARGALAAARRGR